MPYSDLLEGADVALKPNGGVNMSTNTNTNSNCTCGCQDTSTYPNGYWCPPPVNGCPPYPYPQYPYDAPCGTPVGSVESQIAKLSKKSAIIRKMINNLVNCNKSIVISIGKGATYNFGSYVDTEGTETEYGTAILEILEAELASIKEKIVELTAELEVEETTNGAVESTVKL